jgi:hypothetical protein
MRELPEVASVGSHGEDLERSVRADRANEGDQSVGSGERPPARRSR